MSSPAPPPEGLATRLEARLTIPVALAALMSVPAVFMVLWGNQTVAQVGNVVNWSAGAVLWGEWLLLFFLADDRLTWFKRHKWTISVALLSIPAVLFTLGPAQILRILIVLSSFKILRVRRIISSGMVLQRRLQFSGWRRVSLFGSISAISALFLVVVLVDPKGETQLLAHFFADKLGVLGAAIVALLALASVLGFLWRYSRNRSEETDT